MKAMTPKKKMHATFTKSWSPIWIGKCFSWRLTSIMYDKNKVVEMWSGKRLPAAPMTAMKAKK
jgi:hypothetical protein